MNVHSLTASKWLAIVALIVCSQFALSAAPDDIKTDMRAWYDGLDIDGDNSAFTDLPSGNGNKIPQWHDKSGHANHISNSNTVQQPFIQGTGVNQGVKFSGGQILSDSDDIWNGPVTDVDVFAVVSTDVNTNNFMIASLQISNVSRRLSMHLPWNNGTTYWDRGHCCGASARVSGISGTVIGDNKKSLWNFYGSHSTVNDPFSLTNQGYVIRNGNQALSRATYNATYSPIGGSRFGVGGAAVNVGNYFNGTYGEVILYQRTLNLAERLILNSYLHARWENLRETLNRDRYVGDDHGYRYHVGGIGKESTGSVITGTSVGLTIDQVTDVNGGYLLAGLDALTPSTGTATVVVDQLNYAVSQRQWFLDRTQGSATGTATLTFDLANMGYSLADGETVQLLYKTVSGSTFSVLQSANVSGTQVSFSLTDPLDGVYTIGNPIPAPKFTVQKTANVIEDPVNGTNQPKAIPGAELQYDITISNSGFGRSDTDTVVINDILSSRLELFTGASSGTSPFEFADSGAVGCGLTFSFDTSNVNSTNDDVEFYDGANNTLTVVTSSDYDANIRRIEVTPKGAFKAKVSGGVDPACIFQYRTRLN